MTRARFSSPVSRPVEYVAVAVTDLDRAMWADPERLERLRAFATPFAMVEGARTEIKLEVKR